MRVRILYNLEDLPISSILPSNRNPAQLGSIQGKAQLVQGDFEEVVHLANILRLADRVAVLSIHRASLPILTSGTKWIRRDVEVKRTPIINKFRGFSIAKVRSLLCPTFIAVLMNFKLQPGGPICDPLHCRQANFHLPERDVVRFCTECRIWYHVGCLELLDQVSNLRGGHPEIRLPAWLTWFPPAHAHPTVANELVEIITLPIQRGFVGLAAGYHPIISLESLLRLLRHDVLAKDFELPSTLSCLET